MKSKLTAAIAALMTTSASSAYEITTHALITDHAYRASVLNKNDPKSIVSILGFDRLPPDNPFAQEGVTKPVRFHDEAAAPDAANYEPTYDGNYWREQQAAERITFDSLIAGGYIPGPSGNSSAQRVRSWLMRGAIREDDNDVPVGDYWFSPSSRDTDPFGGAVRAPRHFYDPIYDRAFDFSNLCADPRLHCKKSINWSLGRTSPLSPAADAEDLLRRNHFTWQDARNNYWWALTLKRDEGLGGYDDQDVDRDMEDRMSRWATMLQSIGQVVHLLQDTAQPQHVRNDAHLPPLLGGLSEGASDAAFEAFTDFRILRAQVDPAATAYRDGGNPLRSMDGGIPSSSLLPTLRLGQFNYYPGGDAKVQFSTPVKFFTTRHIETGADTQSIKSRRGLADMANRNYFTSGTMPGFRECRPTGMPDCMPMPDPTYTLPLNDLSDGSYAEVATTEALGMRIRDRLVATTEYIANISDRVAPGYDQTVNSLAAYGGRAPLLTKSVWQDIFPDDLGAEYRQSVGYVLSYSNMHYMADVMVPRAVGYSAGMINFFFRGRLEIEPIDQDVFAVLDQGNPHIMSGQHPRITKRPTDTFGFEKVRMKVRNVTEPVVESGTAQSVPQVSGGAGSQLLAVARYRLNGCYKPDLSGERQKSFSGVITEPSCDAQHPSRSSRSLISVSLPLNVAAGELDSTAVEKTFDFSRDPIPVNASDLFVQVVYRGKLGDEPDGIAIGSYDVSEPTFVSFWNNTDYFWNGANYLPHNATYQLRNVYSFRACAGVPSKLIYHYSGSTASVAMGFPPPANQVRLAMIFGKPDNATQRFPVRAVPIMQTAPHAQVRSNSTRGQIRQASTEEVSATVLAQPYENCAMISPASEKYWCADPIHVRRGQRFGSVAQHIYYSTNAGGNGPDVDSVSLPTFAATTVRDGGEVRFNDSGTLVNCPAQPTAASEEESQINSREIEMLLPMQ